MSVDVLGFLAAVHDADEQAARAATAGPWKWTGELCWSPTTEECANHRHDWGHIGPDLDGANGEGVISSSGYDADQVIVSREDATHIARHDPQLVLARVEAERALVALHQPAGQTCTGDEDDPAAWWQYCATCGSGEPNEYPTWWPCPSLRVLAWGYRGREGFDPAWTPEDAEVTS